MAYLGLQAQQHRGQEGAGLVAIDNSGPASFTVHRGLGLVADIFADFDFAKLPGTRAIGHVRYSTAGGHRLANVQPFFAEVSRGRMALAHNGNLINADALRSSLIESGSIFGSTSDTEVIMHLIARGERNVPLVENVIAALQQIQGAYSLLILFEDRVMAVRDPRGFRPLVLGRLNGAHLIASETCAFDLLGAEFVREIEAGELLEISGDGEMRSYRPFPLTQESPCIFEHVYFARPDSVVFGQSVYQVRKRLGEELAREHPAKADIVVPVPDSGTTAALGFSQASGLPLELGLIRSHYIGRTFIEPKQSIRDFGVKLKLNANAEVLRGKSIVVVDDSIVRGTTSRKLVALLRRAGAREVHLRISSPPTTDPCYYGVDTPQKTELIAAQKSVEEIASYIGVDSLGYLSLEGLHRAVESKPGSMCAACFSGSYPAGRPQDCVPKQKKLL